MKLNFVKVIFYIRDPKTFVKLLPWQEIGETWMKEGFENDSKNSSNWKFKMLK
jgi:hypothetical protein